MVWFLVFLVIVMGAMLAIKWNNFYGLTFAVGFLAVEILILVTIFSTAKFGTYQYQTQIEFEIYHKIRRVKVNYYDLKKMANIGIWLFSAIMLIMAWKNRIKHNRIQNTVLYGGLLGLVSIWMLILDSPRLHEKLYIAEHSGRHLMGSLGPAIQKGELLLVFICCIQPLWRIAYLHRRTRLRIQKKYLLSVFISVSILITIFLMITLSPPIKYFLWSYQSNDFRKLYEFYRDPGFILSFIWLFGLIVGIILLLVRFDILKEKNFVKRKWSYRNSSIRLNDLRHVFHSYKNAMFSIECMCKTAREEYGTPESQKALQDILTCAEGYHGQISKFLNIYNYSDIHWDRFRLQDTLQEARKRVGSAGGISVMLYTETEDDFVYGDWEMVVEMFINLLNNSREAILRGEKGEGEIQIRVWTESMLCCVSILDNGEGMDKSTMRNLYAPFFTTKKTFQNWGIGMSQIRKTVESHQGSIDVDSKVGKYTEFQIALPLDL